MAKQTKYNVRLRGVLPFNSVSIPGQNPSVVIGRDGAVLTRKQLGALKEGMGEGALSDLSKDNLQVEKIKPSAEPEEETEPSGGNEPEGDLTRSNFTSDAAFEAAGEAGLTDADFEGEEASGSDGKYTKKDAKRIAEPEEE